MKIKQRDLLELMCIFIITIIFILIFKTPSNDDIWNYGFAYNIANGMIPYSDFNMVTTPLYPIINAIFMKIIGKSIITIYIVISFISTMIFCYMKKYNPRSYYITYTLLLVVLSPNYNIVCLLLLYMIIDLERNERSDYLIGFLLGLTFLTKQSIGLCLCLPTIFTKNINKILKRVIGFVVPNIILIAYLIYNHALSPFINYCFLGLSDFGSKNNLLILPLAIMIVISIFYWLIKYFQSKDYKLLYLICFFGMSYPIVDPFHVTVPLIPTIDNYICKLKLNKKIIMSAFVILIAIITIYNFYNYYCNDEITYPNSTTSYKYNKFNKRDAESIVWLSNYLKKSDKNTFIINSAAYILKLEASIPINKYDLLLTGNSGKDGTKHLINDFEKICRKEKCTFWVYNKSYNNTDYYTQYDKKLHEYVINNYQKYDEILGITIYKNY